MDTSKALVFYILREKSEDTTKDFPNLVYDIRNSFIFIDVIENSPESITLSGSANYKSEIAHITQDRPSQFAKFSFCAKLTISPEDHLTFNKFRHFLNRQNDDYRVYSQQLHSFLPNDSNLVSLEFGSVNLKTFEALKKYSLLPVFYLPEKRTYYAIHLIDKDVHLINPYLLEYIFDKIVPETSIPELSYPVSPNLNLFSAMYDKDLIPQEFYEYFGLSTKIINYSHFNILQQNRKVFIKPYIFEFQQENGSFYTYTGKDGGSLIAMDKIRPGESLDQSLIRVLKDELKISPDYVAAAVSAKVEFDRDRDGILTPRLVILVYVDKINDREWALQMSQTGWKSKGGELPKVNLNPDFNQSK